MRRRDAVKAMAGVAAAVATNGLVAQGGARVETTIQVEPWEGGLGSERDKPMRHAMAYAYGGGRVLCAALWRGLSTRGADGGIRGDLARGWRKENEGRSWMFQLEPGTDVGAVAAYLNVLAGTGEGNLLQPWPEIFETAQMVQSWETLGDILIAQLAHPMHSFPRVLSAPAWKLPVAVAGEGPYRLAGEERQGIRRVRLEAAAGGRRRARWSHVVLEAEGSGDRRGHHVDVRRRGIALGCEGRIDPETGGSRAHRSGWERMHPLRLRGVGHWGERQGPTLAARAALRSAPEWSLWGRDGIDEASGWNVADEGAGQCRMEAAEAFEVLRTVDHRQKLLVEWDWPTPGGLAFRVGAALRQAGAVRASASHLAGYDDGSAGVLQVVERLSDDRALAGWLMDPSRSRVYWEDTTWARLRLAESFEPAEAAGAQAAIAHTLEELACKARLVGTGVPYSRTVVGAEEPLDYPFDPARRLSLDSLMAPHEEEAA